MGVKSREELAKDSPTNYLDVIEDAVEYALALGATYSEARFHSRKGDSLFLVNDSVAGGGFEAEEGIAVRVIVDGALGFASTTDTSREGVRRAVETAIAAARSTASAFKKKVRLSNDRLGRVRYSVSPVKGFRDVSLDDKVSMIKEYSKDSVGSSRIEITSKVFRYSDEEEYKVIVTSDGGFVESLIPRVSVFYNIAAKHGGRRANKWGHVAGSGGLEVLDMLGLGESIASDVRSLEVNLADAEAPPTGVMDVIISPEIVGLALHESIGHPSEADRVLGREAAQAGLSYRMWSQGRIGSRHVTVADDPTIPGSYGYYLYDDEAVPARERILIDKGELAEYLQSRTTAPEFGVESNGAARAMNYRSEPIVRMANTYLKPGDMSFEELVEDVKLGVYMKAYMEWNIDEYRLVSRYVGLEAYLIKNGKIDRPVRDVILEIPSTTFYQKIDGVGKDLKFYAGICGKGEPPQPLPVWMGGPHVRVRGIKIG